MGMFCNISLIVDFVKTENLQLENFICNLKICFTKSILKAPGELNGCLPAVPAGLNVDSF
jgi:hypothetical protein